MATRLTQRELLALKLELLNDTEVQDLLEYLAMVESTSRSGVTSSVVEDDTVEFLAEAQENKRARQAFEWEAARRRAERRVGAAPGHRA